LIPDLWRAESAETPAGHPQTPKELQKKLLPHTLVGGSGSVTQVGLDLHSFCWQISDSQSFMSRNGAEMRFSGGSDNIDALDSGPSVGMNTHDISEMTDR
jgi:hypothetical protein